MLLPSGDLRVWLGKKIALIHSIFIHQFCAKFALKIKSNAHFFPDQTYIPISIYNINDWLNDLVVYILEVLRRQWFGLVRLWRWIGQTSKHYRRSWLWTASIVWFEAFAACSSFLTKQNDIFANVFDHVCFFVNTVWYFM